MKFKKKHFKNTEQKKMFGKIFRHKFSPETNSFPPPEKNQQFRWARPSPLENNIENSNGPDPRPGGRVGKAWRVWVVWVGGGKVGWGRVCVRVCGGRMGARCMVYCTLLVYCVVWSARCIASCTCCGEFLLCVVWEDPFDVGVNGFLCSAYSVLRVVCSVLCAGTEIHPLTLGKVGTTTWPRVQFLTKIHGKFSVWAKMSVTYFFTTRFLFFKFHLTTIYVSIWKPFEIHFFEIQ